MNYFETIIEVTSDGSATLYRPDIDEHYHSVKGAVAESRHVYIDSALRYRAAAGNLSGGRVSVLEVGFGTGLNAALSVDAVDVPVWYCSLELYPLGPDVVRPMGYGLFSQRIDDVCDAAWNRPVGITDGFVLEKREVDFLTCDLPEGIDVVYFDAFAPEKQPEMWSKECFARIYAVMNPGGVLTTYCSKGAVRRMLQDVGFIVQRIEGPAGGKREILRAIHP